MKGAAVKTRAQIDTVNLAKKYLLAHPEACKVDVSSPGGTKRDSLGRVNDGREHEHGSLNCIVAFLGESNWSPLILIFCGIPIRPISGAKVDVVSISCYINELQESLAGNCRRIVAQMSLDLP